MQEKDRKILTEELGWVIHFNKSVVQIQNEFWLTFAKWVFVVKAKMDIWNTIPLNEEKQIMRKNMPVP